MHRTKNMRALGTTRIIFADSCCLSVARWDSCGIHHWHDLANWFYEYLLHPLRERWVSGRDDVEKHGRCLFGCLIVRAVRACVRVCVCVCACVRACVRARARVCVKIFNVFVTETDAFSFRTWSENVACLTVRTLDIKQRQISLHHFKVWETKQFRSRKVKNLSHVTVPLSRFVNRKHEQLSIFHFHFLKSKAQLSGHSKAWPPNYARDHAYLWATRESATQCACTTLHTVGHNPANQLFGVGLTSRW